MAQRGRPKKNVSTTDTVVVRKTNDRVLTKEQIKTLRKIEENLTEIRRNLFNFDDCDTVAKMAFCAGQAFNLVNTTEDMMCDVLEEITDEVKFEF